MLLWHTFLSKIHIDHWWQQTLMTIGSVPLGPNILGLVRRRCMSHLVSFLSMLSWWIDTNKRQAYVQASLLAETIHVMPDQHRLPRSPAISSQSSMLMGLEQDEIWRIELIQQMPMALCWPFWWVDALFFFRVSYSRLFPLTWWFTFSLSRRST